MLNLYKNKNKINSKFCFKKKKSNQQMQKNSFENKFEITEEILSEGSYANIFVGKDLKTGEKVAIKKPNRKKKGDTEHVDNESDIYQLFLDDANYKKFLPEIHFLSNDCIVMEMMGPNLLDLFNKCKGKFCLKTVLMLAEQMINILRFVHSKQVVVVDVSPSNFVFGRGDKSKNLYLVDLGMAQKYIDSGGNHIIFSECHGLRGNILFSSLFNNFGLEHARREDMVSLGYILLYFLNGTLPWVNYYETHYQDKLIVLDMANQKEYYRRSLMKKNFKEKDHPYPRELIKFLKHNQRLLFEAEPDYEEALMLFKQLFIKMEYKKDDIYEWELN